jgi:hypothetical protein
VSDEVVAPAVPRVVRVNEVAVGVGVAEHGECPGQGLGLAGLCGVAVGLTRDVLVKPGVLVY